MLIRIYSLLFLICFLFIGAAYLVGGLLPGGGQIAYSADLVDSLDLYLLDMGRGMTLNLTRSPANEYQSTWSPDGLKLAYVSDRNGGRDIFVQAVGCPGVFSACGGEPQRVTFSSANDFSPAWSPDGAYLAYVSEEFFDMEMAVLNMARGDFTPIRLTYHTGMDGDPSWSPDGRQIVFVSNRENEIDADLYVMDAACIPRPRTCDGTVELLLSALDQQLLPSWSPDGRQIVYTTTRNVFRQMALLDLDSTDTPSPLLNGQTADDRPSWSPDGLAILFVSQRDSPDGDVYLLRLDCPGAPTNCVERLTYNEAFVLDPRWRPGS